MKKLLLLSTFTWLLANVSFSQCGGIISPPNEGQDCCNAIELTPKGTSCASTLDLNISGYPLPTGGTSALPSFPTCWGADMVNVSWVTVTATNTGTYTFDPLTYTGGAKDVALQLYTGTCGSLTPAGGGSGCSDADVSKGLNASSITWSATKGTTYYIAMASVSGQDGNTIGGCLQGGTNPPAPPNDFCVNATALTTDVTTEGSLINATSTNTSPDFDEVLCSGSTENNIWFTVKTTTAGDYYLILDNANCSIDIGFQVTFYKASLGTCALIDAAGTGTGNCINYANTGTNDNFQVTLSLAANTTYYFTVDGQSGTECTFDVLFSTVPITQLGTEKLSLNGNKTENGGLLKWNNISERENTVYTVERSEIGKHFEPLSVVNGNGVVKDAEVYTYPLNKGEETGYYRIKMVEFDGKVSYSNIVYLGDPINYLENSVTAFPNPAKDIVTFNYELKRPGYDHTVNVYDVMGKLVYTEIFTPQTGAQGKTLSIDGFENGMHYVVLSNEIDGVIGKNSFFVSK